MPHLLRVIYTSCAVGTIEPALLEALIDESRSRNEKSGISGILVSGRGYFVQALEGPETHVIPLYASILRDARHQQSAMLSVGLVASRAFPQWAMALVEGDPLGVELHDRLVGQALLDRDPSEAVKLLQATLKAIRKAA
jgi:hypothetical protein